MYDTKLTIDQVLTQLREQPKTIAALTAGLPRARLHGSSSRGEWSVNDVLAHLRSCADMWGKYIATIIAEDRPTIRAMNPTTWIRSTNYPELEFAPSLRALTKQRAELLALLRPLPKAGWSRSADDLYTGPTPRPASLCPFGSAGVACAGSGDLCSALSQSRQQGGRSLLERSTTPERPQPSPPGSRR